MKRTLVLAAVSSLAAMAPILAATNDSDEKPLDAGPRASKVVSVGKGPDALFLTPDERFLYVANVEDTHVSVIDTESDRVVTTVDTVDYPWGFTHLGNTSLVAVSGGGQGIAVLDFTAHQVVRRATYDRHLGGIVSNTEGTRL